MSTVHDDLAVRERIRELSERETEVAQEFSKNIRDGVRTVSLDPGQLGGLPADFVEAHGPGRFHRMDFAPCIEAAERRRGMPAIAA